MSLPAVVLGLDYGGTKIAAVACDLTGRQLGSTVLTSGGELGAQASFERGIRAGRELLGTRAAGARLAAVGVSTFGIPFEDRVELAPAISGWDKLAMGPLLRAAFPGAEVRMATDTKAAAQAEARWGALADCDPAVYLNLGTGLAAAIVVGGQVVAGSDGAAGEIGYNLRCPADVGVPAERRTLLEDMVSGQALARLGTRRQAGRPAAGPDQPGAGSAGAAPAARPLTAAEVFDAAEQDGALRELITEFTAELAFHLVNLTIAVNPARIAVGGGMARSFEQIRPGLQDALTAGAPFPPELVLARFPQDAPLLGAVALALDAAGQRAFPDGLAGADGAGQDGWSTGAVAATVDGVQAAGRSPGPAGAHPGPGQEPARNNAGVAV
jgi:glucokinase